MPDQPEASSCGVADPTCACSVGPGGSETPQAPSKWGLRPHWGDESVVSKLPDPAEQAQVGPKPHKGWLRGGPAWREWA
eukprot:5013713-Alexandrium_andersonii.AAC.1